MAKNFLYDDDADGWFQEDVSAYETTDFINASAGAGDAGKPIVLDAGGHIDASMINDADIDHGGLGGLGDDDHTQYSLVDGSRAYTAKVSYSAHPTFSADTEIVDKKYVDDQIASNISGLEWQDSVLDADLLDPPGGPTSGDRYLINGVGINAWAGQDNSIAEWNGASWDFTAPTTGMHVSADDESTLIYYYGGSSWSQQFWENTTASTGLTKVGVDIRIDSSAAGGGIGFAAGVLSVNAEGLEIDTDDLDIDWSTAFNDLKAVAAQDLNSTTNGEGASIIGVEDVGGYFTSGNVEGALQELGNAIPSAYEHVLAGTVAKGDALYFSTNDEVSEYANITVKEMIVGIAQAAGVATNTIAVAKDFDVVTGVLSGATAGDRYFWNGTAHSTTMAGAGYIWQTGIAQNATDLLVMIDPVKKA